MYEAMEQGQTPPWHQILIIFKAFIISFKSAKF